MECVVEYDYAASQPDELTLRKGDVIKSVVEFEDGWFRGELNGKTGVFPDNFVKVVNKGSKASGALLDANWNSGDKNGESANEEELPGFVRRPSKRHKFGVGLGDIFRGQQPNLKTVQSDAKTKIETTEPQAVEKPAKPPSSKSDSGGEKCRVKFAYKGANPDELDLEVGDVITILDKEIEEGWWRGELHGRQGVFPDNFVELVPASVKTAAPPSTAPSTQPVTSTPTINQSVTTDAGQKRNITGPVPSAKPAAPALPQRPHPPPKVAPPAKPAPNAATAKQDAKKTPTAVESKDTTDGGNLPTQQKHNLLSALTADRPRQPGKRPPGVFNKAGEQDDATKDINAPPTNTSTPAVATSNPQLVDASAGIMEELKAEIKAMHAEILAIKEGMVPLSEVKSLRSEMERNQHLLNTRIQTLLEEIDEEKKLRATDQVQLARLRQIVNDLSLRSPLNS